MGKISDDEYSKLIAECLYYEYKTGIKNGLYDHTQIIMSYHSNKIEGSTLSLDDTASLYDSHSINSKATIRERDINDSEGHFLMFKTFVENIDTPLSEDLIKKYHGALKHYSVYDNEHGFNIGEYKVLANSIGGLIQTVSPEDVPREMKEWLNLYNTRHSYGHTYNSLARSHSSFEHIHPFQDGNGRVGRMILFKQCLDENMVPCVITENMSSQYKDCLKQIAFGQGDIEDLGVLFEIAATNYRSETELFIESFRAAKERGQINLPEKTEHKMIDFKQSPEDRINDAVQRSASTDSQENVNVENKTILR